MCERLFTEEELAYVAPKADPVPSLAVRFVAREAVMKAMGLGLGAFGFHEVWVSRAATGEPSLRVTGRAAELGADRGISHWHLSLTHPTSSRSPTSSPSDRRVLNGRDWPPRRFGCSVL